METKATHLLSIIEFLLNESNFNSHDNLLLNVIDFMLQYVDVDFCVKSNYKNACPHLHEEENHDYCDVHSKTECCRAQLIRLAQKGEL